MELRWIIVVLSLSCSAPQLLSTVTASPPPLNPSAVRPDFLPAAVPAAQSLNPSALRLRRREAAVAFLDVPTLGQGDKNVLSVETSNRNSGTDKTLSREECSTIKDCASEVVESLEGKGAKGEAREAAQQLRNQRIRVDRLEYRLVMGSARALLLYFGYSMIH